MLKNKTHPSEAITGSLMISCEIGQMNSGGQSESDGTQSCAGLQQSTLSDETAINTSN